MHVPRSQSDGLARGKAVRPALVCLAAEALGGSATYATPGAVAVELIHNFALIHDDIMDTDATRRNRPALWKQFGVGPALLTGDGFHVLAMDTLLRTRGARSGTAVALINRAMIATMHGQVRDLGFVARPWTGASAVSVEEVRVAAAGKTGAFMACAAALGALLAGGESRHVASFAAFGRHLGTAFQCVDDILGLFGDPQRTGKPVGSDLLLARKTIPVVAACTADTPASAHLRNRLESRDAPLCAQDMPEILHLVEEAGGVVAARHEAERQMTAALQALAGVRMPQGVRDECTLFGEPVGGVQQGGGLHRASEEGQVGGGLGAGSAARSGVLGRGSGGAGHQPASLSPPPSMTVNNRS
jgi:geranylgeranyl diphosphate synthase type I